MTNQNKKLLLTGGMGFVGAHVVEGILKNKNDWDIIILDRLDISGTTERLTDMKIWEKKKHRVKFVWWDLKSPMNGLIKKEIGHIDYIWHLAASSHVDRSIEDPLSFVMDNVVGTCNLLNYARELPELKKFIYFSTDEVFGPALNGTAFKEWDRYNSGNPYAASKAGGEELCLAFANTYKLPIIITHTMNVCGERQHPEKFIPSCIKKILNGEVVTIHASADKKTSGSRFYIHARNVCRALLFLNEKGVNGDKYNVVGEKEISNLDLAGFIAKTLGKDLLFEMTDFHSSRPGHDLRYALDGGKLEEMGFYFTKSFEESLEKTIKWYLKDENKKWLE